MGRVSKPTSPSKPSRARGERGRENLSWEGGVRQWRQRIYPLLALPLPGVFVKVGGDLLLPEPLFEGLEPACVKWCSVRCDSLAAMWGLS